jgi:outer membrane protein OmpA-like peptidoglycan-associated protein
MRTTFLSSILFAGAVLLLLPQGSRAFFQDEDQAIPPDAHDKAVLALKALGPSRGAKKITYRAVDILGVSRGISFNSKQLAEAIKDLGAKETGTEVQIELSGDILFDFDKWNIRAGAEKDLKKVGGIINAYKSPEVIISGHTDSKGSDEYNLTLSKKRAESVKDWLVKNAGVDASIIQTAGYGESKPTAPNTNPDGTDNPEGRQKNRRVEILAKKQSR